MDLHYQGQGYDPSSYLQMRTNRNLVVTCKIIKRHQDQHRVSLAKAYIVLLSKGSNMLKKPSSISSHQDERIHGTKDMINSIYRLYSHYYTILLQSPCITSFYSTRRSSPCSFLTRSRSKTHSNLELSGSFRFSIDITICSRHDSNSPCRAII